MDLRTAGTLRKKICNNCGSKGFKLVGNALQQEQSFSGEHLFLRTIKLRTYKCSCGKKITIRVVLNSRSLW